jgi:hypothetical protein
MVSFAPIHNPREKLSNSPDPRPESGASSGKPTDTNSAEFEFYGNNQDGRATNSKQMILNLKRHSEPIDTLIVEDCSLSMKQLLTSLKTNLLELSLSNTEVLPQDCLYLS